MKTSQRGWTLVEALISLAVTAIALGAAVPGFHEARERRHLDGAAAQLETDLQLARSLAVLHNRTVRVDFRTGSTGSCYVVHSGGPGDCSCDASGAATCSPGAEALRSTGYPSSLPITLTSNAASMAFEHVRGTVTPTSTVRITGRGRAVHVVTNIMGRVRSCSPSSAAPGYPAC
ncbi:MAG: GspH/FimT family pseudopilin [Betaproteobacteria bacterium]|nr:GspH/FimT family pseudopilin [Betaproteobacteria bacterium]